MNFDVKVVDSLGAECTQPVTIVVNAACPDWNALSWTAPILTPGVPGGIATAVAAGATVSVVAVSALGNCSQIEGMVGTVTYTGDAFDAYIVFEVTNYFWPANTVSFTWQVLQNATQLALVHTTSADNVFHIEDADGLSVHTGEMPGTPFSVHIQGVAAVGSVITVQGSGLGWAFVCPGGPVGELAYNLSISCTPP